MTKELNLFQNDIESTELQDIVQTLEDLNESQDDFVQIDIHVIQHIKRVIEALLFASNEPIPLVKMREITDTIIPCKPRRLKLIIEELQQEYVAQHRAFKLEEIAQGYVLRSREEYASYIELLYRQKRGEKLSHASTEVLAIIAYRQPITRPQIDAIRGVDSSGTVAQLLERNLIEPAGKLEAPGRPMLYVTTKEFLKHFGLKDISDLSGHVQKNKPKQQLTLEDLWSAPKN